MLTVQATGEEIWPGLDPGWVRARWAVVEGGGAGLRPELPARGWGRPGRRGTGCRVNVGSARVSFKGGRRVAGNNL